MNEYVFILRDFYFGWADRIVILWELYKECYGTRREIFGERSMVRVDLGK